MLIPSLVNSTNDATKNETNRMCLFVQDMMEEQRSKMDDLEKWENMTIESSQSIDLRLQRLEDTAQQTASLLAVIHR